MEVYAAQCSITQGMDIIAFLEQEQVLEKVKGFNEIKSGASGAKVYEAETINGRFIIKHIQKDGCKSDDNWASFEREWRFYSICKDLKISFIPDLVFMSREENKDIIMVFNSYERIPHKQWLPRMQLKAMDLCARLNSIDTGFAQKIGIEFKKTEADKESLDNAYQEWQYVLSSYGSRFGGNVLKHIYENFDKICDIINAPPYNICHGDFQPDNILLNFNNGKGGLVLCDWQNISIGKGIGDISFFLSRSKDFDIEIDEDALISFYCERLSHYTEKTIEKADMYRIKNASTVLASFIYWGFYLAGTDGERVANIYNEMAKSYLSLNL